MPVTAFVSPVGPPIYLLGKDVRTNGYRGKESPMFGKRAPETHAKATPPQTQAQQQARKAFRIPVAMSVWFTEAPNRPSSLAKATNISITGMRVLVPGRLPANAIIHVRFQLPGDDQTEIKCRARVVYAAMPNAGEVGLAHGLSLELSGVEMDMIRRYVRNGELAAIREMKPAPPPLAAAAAPLRRAR